MTTIMTWGNSDGTKGRCDASCHNAKHARCVCMCGGRYHAAAHQPGGVEQAVRDTWEEAIEQAEQKAKAEGMELDVKPLRQFIGLEPANPANGDNHANHTNHTNHRRQWGTINRSNQKIGVQESLPLEAAR